ncbi:hypothetical protein NQZ68_021047 [Dissostichus eleginoides]|nr:hypothetical protein NQZ68_021047 [Dissostichus eleginoides]
MDSLARRWRLADVTDGLAAVSSVVLPPRMKEDESMTDTNKQSLSLLPKSSRSEQLSACHILSEFSPSYQREETELQRNHSSVSLLEVMDMCLSSLQSELVVTPLLIIHEYVLSTPMAALIIVD